MHIFLQIGEYLTLPMATFHVFLAGNASVWRLLEVRIIYYTFLRHRRR